MFYDHALAAQLLAVQLVNGVVGVAGVLELHETVPEEGRSAGRAPAGVSLAGAARSRDPPLRALEAPPPFWRPCHAAPRPRSTRYLGGSLRHGARTPRCDSPIFEVDFEEAAVAAEKALDVLLADIVAQASYVDARHGRGGWAPGG